MKYMMRIEDHFFQIWEGGEPLCEPQKSAKAAFRECDMMQDTVIGTIWISVHKDSTKLMCKLAWLANEHAMIAFNLAKSQLFETKVKAHNMDLVSIMLFDLLKGKPAKTIYDSEGTES